MCQLDDLQFGGNSLSRSSLFRTSYNRTDKPNKLYNNTAMFNQIPQKTNNLSSHIHTYAHVNKYQLIYRRTQIITIQFFICKNSVNFEVGLFLSFSIVNII